MAKLSALLLLCSAASTLVSGRALSSFSVSTNRRHFDRDTVNAVGHLRSGTGSEGNFSTHLGKSLYWFGDFSVGDSGYVSLLIDTGSADILLNNGIYKASKNQKPFPGQKNFSITYEGVNRAGFGFETINGTAYLDTVTSGGLTVKEQAMVNTTSFKYFDVPPLSYANPGQGIIGFEGPWGSAFKPSGARSWFYNLMHYKTIAENRFGLAFGTSGKGSIQVGKLATNLIKGKPVYVPYTLANYSSYLTMGDFTVDGKVFAADQHIIMDVGTDNIQGPLEVTKKAFEKFGFTSVTKTAAPNPHFDPGHTSITLLGFFPCDKPPSIGFSFPAQSQLKKGQTATNFNVSTATGIWDVYDHGHNNCTSILGGTNALNLKSETAWLLGQPFFAGHYIDFNVEASEIGYADLLDPVGESA